MPNNAGTRENALLKNAQPATALASGDPYGRNATGATGSSASFRQRGDASQKRVNNDTRVRDDANSGTAGANGEYGSQGAMSAALGGDQSQSQQSPQPVTSAAWQGTRQPVDLASVRSRVLQSLKPQQGF